MSAIKRIARVFSAFLASILLLSACIFPFTHLTGVHGYASIVICASIVVALIGGLMLRGASSSRVSTHQFEHSGHLDPQVAEEIRKNRNRGTTLGMELFYNGVACAAIGYLLYKVTL